MNMENQRLSYCMLCEQWNEEEDAWFYLFADAFQGSDDLSLTIFLPKNNGLNQKKIEEQIVFPKLTRHPLPVRVNVVEIDDFTTVSCDYWLMNSAYRTYGNYLKGRYGHLEKPVLEEVDKTYSGRHQSRNPYEYDFLVDMYDAEKGGQEFETFDEGLIPKQFGSSGGESFRALLGDVRRICADKAALLEIGCGAGAFYKTLAVNKLPFHYTGIDFSRKQILRCLRNYPGADFRVGNACSLTLGDNVFDFVFENNALIFTLDPVQAISEMIRVSKSHIRYTVHALPGNEGLYCYYSFTHKVKFNPETKSIQVSDEEKRFFKGDIWYSPAGKDRIEAMVVKAPIYIPSRTEYDRFIMELTGRGNVEIVRQEIGTLEKVVWVNDAFTTKDVATDDCVVSSTDEKKTLTVESISCILKKNK